MDFIILLFVAKMSHTPWSRYSTELFHSNVNSCSINLSSSSNSDNVYVRLI